jgi:hypothetical protein
MPVERKVRNGEREQQRANSLYDEIQGLLWSYTDFSAEEIGEIVKGAVLEHCTNYGSDTPTA